MPLRDHMQIISVDDHLIEHPRVFSDRLPARYLAQGPRIVEDEKGRHIWHFEDKVFPYIGLNAVAGKSPEEYGMEPLRFEDMIPGCYDPAERVRDMDVDGVQAACCFPSFPGFGGRVFLNAGDKELALACLPSFHSDHWGPLWDAFEETGVVVSLHFGSGSFVPGFSASAKQLSPAYRGGGFRSVSERTGGAGAVRDDDAPTVTSFAVYATNLMWTASDLVFSGQLQKHPRLKFMLAEGGIGWFPYLAERMDQVWERHRYYQPIDFDARPSELFRKHFWGCYIQDGYGIRNRHAIGIDRICVEIDYPHSDSNWPNSRKQIAESLADVPDGEAHRIVELNAREAFNFPRS